MASRKLEVVITGDTTSLDKALGRTSKSANRVRKGMLALGAGIAGGLVVGLKKSVDAALESEKAQARLGSALESAGLSQEKYGRKIQETINKTSKLAALDDEDLSDSFSKLVRTTGDVTKATEGMNLAVDIARARNISLETATKAVEKAYLGSATGLKKFGVEVATSTSNMDFLKTKIDEQKEAMKDLTGAELEAAKIALNNLEAQKDVAKQQDKNAAGLATLKEAQDQFAGSAEKYGKTSAAAQERFQVALENLQEKIGSAVLPILKDFIDRLTSLLGWVEKNETAAKVIIVSLAGFAAALVTLSVGAKAVAAATQLATAAQWLYNAALSANPVGVVVIAIAALAVGIAVAYTKSEKFRDIVNSIWGALKRMGGWITNNWDTISSVIEKAPMVLVFKAMKEAIGEIIAGFKWLIENASKLKIPSVPGWLDPRNIGDPRDAAMAAPSAPSSGAGAGNLMGASPVMAPFAANAAAYGLQVTSGLRPGAITANGTPSDHGIGKALDVAGSAGGMAGFFASLIGNRSVKQAFYDPLGSIFAGALSSYREGGHSDHVHVATYDKGGMLQPGWTMAYNGTGKPEPVGAGAGWGSGDIVIKVGEIEIARAVRNGNQRLRSQGVSV